MVKRLSNVKEVKCWSWDLHSDKHEVSPHAQTAIAYGFFLCARIYEWYFLCEEAHFVD